MGDSSTSGGHLNAGQKALIALEYEKAIAAATKVGRPIGDAPKPQATLSEKTVADLPPFPSQVSPPKPFEAKSRERAAKVVGASGRAVQQAKALQRDAPDLAEKVRAGQVALDAADRQRKQRVAAMPKPDPVPSKPGPVMLTLHTNTGGAWHLARGWGCYAGGGYRSEGVPRTVAARSWRGVAPPFASVWHHQKQDRGT
ncbi:hypothetical protein [Streptosporangium pseudovulgare]|uniref:Uncharacterized protein n=1 Tax=Streptosporangium pseudovulgare TaxID=35765 RepID=A0ABQ2RE20_9ACTN|nr:hypothetical protein [Streptosporangium pseudovulgare]GGQ23586.1 hypothetical protein GCM10010140_62330 [Streptosporangium pseudovulgare]